MSGTVLKWIHNFLCQRMQKFVFGSRRSSPSFYCTKGVPQGSVLSHLPFNICVSDLQSLANLKENNTFITSFADDLTLYQSDTSAEQASKKMSVQRTNQLNMRSDLCVAICKFSQVVFVTSNKFMHNLLFYFQ